MGIFGDKRDLELNSPDVDQGVGGNSVLVKDKDITPLLTDYQDPSLQQSLIELNMRLRDLSKTLIRVGSLFPTSKQYKWNLGGYAAQASGANAPLNGFPAPNNILTATLNGKPIRSAYIENNATTNAVSFFEGTEGGALGTPLVKVSKGTWRVIALDDDNFGISCTPTIPDTGLLVVIVTDQVWIPAMGNIV